MGAETYDRQVTTRRLQLSSLADGVSKWNSTRPRVPKIHTGIPQKSRGAAFQA
jgi:hypothetical protein